MRWTESLSAEICCEPESLLEVQDLSLAYGKKWAFKNINMKINRNCVTGILGPSGCGKSSFLQCLNRLIELEKNTVVHGRVILNEQNIFEKGYSVAELRKRVGLIFQEPVVLPLSIYQNISVPLKEHAFQDIEARVLKALKDVGLFEEVKDRLKDSAENLSGGQKQRLCIARAIALEPEVLLLDEPCSSLDPISTEKIELLLKDLKKKYTMVVVTHNVAQARRMCDHIGAFWYNSEYSGGELIAFGSTKDIFDSPQNEPLRQYLGGVRG